MERFKGSFTTYAQCCGVFKYYKYLNTKSAQKSIWSKYLNTQYKSIILNTI